MSLVIENGSVVAGADSFATAAELVTYAGGLGLAIPSTEAGQEAILRRSYKEMAGRGWKGSLVSAIQTGAFPRIGVCRDGLPIPSNVIPAQIKDGQMALATEIHADDLAPPELKTGAVTEERVEGAVDVKYAAASGYISRRAAGRLSDREFSGFSMSSSQISMVRG